MELGYIGEEHYDSVVKPELMIKPSLYVKKEGLSTESIESRRERSKKDADSKKSI